MASVEEFKTQEKIIFSYLLLYLPRFPVLRVPNKAAHLIHVPNVFNTLMYVGSRNCTARFMYRSLIIYVNFELDEKWHEII